MMKFNVGALRPAGDDARSESIAAANDLVRRTLARNGLWAGGEDEPAATVQPAAPMMEMLSAHLGLSILEPRIPEKRLPVGAEFRQDIYTCAQGRRTFRTYVPSTATEGIEGILVMLHGCTQNPADFATGTGMNGFAESHRLIIVYPQQSRGENGQSCWNWFRRGDQLRDRGEPAILAGIARKVAAEFDVAPKRTFVAGLSAGAAMAVILGETYPDVFSAVGVHSGLPFGAAKDVPSAFEAMAGRGEDKITTRNASPTPTIVIHGTADAVVHSSNAGRIARGVIDRAGGVTVETEVRSGMSGRAVHRTVTKTVEGAPILEQWHIDGLGHAWSGGRPGGSYTDPAGPDASAEMIRFFFETAAWEG
ncbi:MAG TPA: PHB depolymerase family esterase [Afifellaceae bacterium]|nr:PHB depolymerase family esterase [Afifellaceae bacterium]